MSGLLAGDLALVTGAGNGIGRATAVALAREGARMILANDDPTMSKLVPLGRLGAPEDIGDMAVALPRDRFSRYVTGTTVVVDGGLALHDWIAPRAD